tara:strand:+ start:96 stop:875 length:780 start_codon:yes stop_codon:yes gene_type:complete
MIASYDFTIFKYIELINFFSKNNIPTYTFKEWLELKPKNGVLLRHDVDRKAKNSLDFAYELNRHNRRGTFNFRTTKSSYKVETIKKISSMKNEIGYHYEDYSDCKGSMPDALKSFEENLSKIRNICSVDTITMHGSPLSRFDNRDMWLSNDFKSYKLIGEGYLSIDYKNIYYFTDTGRTWGNTTSNIRDKVNNSKIVKEKISSTNELINFINNNRDESFVLVFHPERWASTLIDYIFQFIFDKITSIIKRLINYKNRSK